MHLFKKGALPLKTKWSKQSSPKSEPGRKLHDHCLTSSQLNKKQQAQAHVKLYQAVRESKFKPICP